MADKPEKFPDWALEDEVDEVSGQLNVVEPPAQRFDSGWTRREIPPRQWMNWLLRKTALWFRWLEEKVEGLQEGVDGLEYANESEAQDGTEPGKVISPLTLRQAINADNAPPVFGVRAWANFDGTSANGDGVISIIRGSGNIEQIERLSEGLYEITFDVPMPDENYAVTVGMSQNIDGAGNLPDQANVFSFTTSGFQMRGTDRTNDTFLGDQENLNFCVVR